MLAALSVWAGLIASRGFTGGRAAGLVVTLLSIAAAAALAVLALRPRSQPRAAVFLAAALLTAAFGRGTAAHVRLELERARITDGETLWIEGEIDEPPALESESALATVRVRAARPALVAGCRVRLRLPEGTSAEWGDRVLAFARLAPPDAPRNPGGFDARAAADAAGIAARGVALHVRVRAAGGLAAWPRATVMRWRRALERRLHEGLSPPTLELVAPLVFGDRSAVDTDLDAAFRAAGLTHLLALSGLHVVWLAALARTGAAALGAGVRGRALARGACALLYVLLAGPIPSLARAAAQELITAAARFGERAIDPLQALAAATLALLVACPGWALDLGFQLSCAATVGLVTIGAWLATARGRARPAALLLGPTAAAQLTSLPILLDRFHALAWTSALSNLIAVPLTGVLLSSAWFGALAEVTLPGSGRLFLHACEPLALALRIIVESAGRMPSALIATGDHPALVALAASGAALLAIALAPRRGLPPQAASAIREGGALMGAILSATAIALVIHAAPLQPPPGSYWAILLDVGQGDAIALGTSQGWWLVDAGPRTPHFDAGQSVVLPFLRWAGARRLERLVLTHDDGDHVGGAGAILRGIPVGRVLGPARRPGLPGPLARISGSPIARGELLQNSPRIEVLWPPPPGPDSHFWEHPVTSADNGAVAVLEVGSGEGRALLTADADSAVESALGVRPDLALLKVAHHGSGSSSGASFLFSVRPRLAAISVGRNNRFGHPSEAALERLRESGARLSRTDESGALWFELDDAGARRVEWQGGIRMPGERTAPPRRGAPVPAE